MELFPITAADRAAVDRFIVKHWYTTEMVVRGKVFDLSKAEGLFAREEGQITGLVTYIFYGDTMEILSLDSLRENRGLGSQLLEGAVDQARLRGCRRVVLITTNDNIRAIRFYQKRGFDLAALYCNALDRAREWKPEIPLVSEEGIPIRHELEFERLL